MSLPDRDGSEYASYLNELPSGMGGGAYPEGSRSQFLLYMRLINLELKFNKQVPDKWIDIIINYITKELS